MKLAILMTNTDVSAFSDKHPKDGEKFTALIQTVRPDWTCDVFDATQSEFPEDVTIYDGFMITGSPASVHDDVDWIAQLCGLIVDIHGQELPIFGACFGHQIIAKALGGTVGRNPQGWVLGVADSTPRAVKPWLKGLPASFPLYAAHLEQVLVMPDGGETIAMTEGCPNAGYVIGKTIYTTQYHPEMTPHFIGALVEHLSSDFEGSVIETARASLAVTVQMDVFAESIAAFFEASNPV